MGWMEVGAGAVGLLMLGLPIVVAGWAIKRLIRRRRLAKDELGARGSVHVAEIWLMVATIIFGCGAVLGGVSLLPLLVWIFDDDPEGRRVFFALLGVFAGFCAFAAVMAWPGIRFWIVEPERLTVRRLGRERSIDHAAITEIRERRSVGGLIEVRSTDDRIRVPKQLRGFDEFLSQIKMAAPHAPYVDHRAPTQEESGAAPAVPEAPVTDAAYYSVSTKRTRFIFGFTGSLLVFFWVWPWFGVTGDHQVRDSFIFMGIGTGLWLMILLLVARESFQRHQPAHLELRPNEIAYRLFRKGWEVRPATDLLSASVESDIIYVKGMPGNRYPLFLTFTDGTRLKIDDFRAKHMGASTHRITADLHRRYFDASRYSMADRAESDRLVEAAARAEQAGDLDRAIDLHRHAIAQYPDADRLASYRQVGDLQRQQGDHEGAVSSYRAHLDFAPRDTAAWEGLAASLRERGRDDLAAQAIESAERLLLHG